MKTNKEFAEEESEKFLYRFKKDNLYIEVEVPDDYSDGYYEGYKDALEEYQEELDYTEQNNKETWRKLLITAIQGFSIGFLISYVVLEIFDYFFENLL